MRAAAPLAAAVLVIALASGPAATAPAGNPHEFQRIGCTHCHVLVPGQGRVLQRNVFRKNIDDLCQECHAAALEDNLNHRVGIRPSMKVPEDLHLNEKGEMSCVTCHDPHAEYISSKTGNRTWFLRRQMLKRELCLACHAEQNYQEPKTTIRLLAPANNAVVDRLPVPLIGTVSDQRLAEVSVQINDADLVLSVRNSTFSTMLTLREGINTIRISGQGVVPVVLNILHNPALPADMTYRLYRSHGMLTRKDCSVCHDERARSYAIAIPDAQLCFKCHERWPVEKFVHGPVAIGSCTVCHDPHGQTNPALLVASGEALCFRCHTEADALKHLAMRTSGSGDFLRDKGCVYCHDPHQGDRKFLLRQKG
jgi:predicted CXXCH cytochrome family protein